MITISIKTAEKLLCINNTKDVVYICEEGRALCVNKSRADICRALANVFDTLNFAFSIKEEGYVNSNYLVRVGRDSEPEIKGKELRWVYGECNDIYLCEGLNEAIIYGPDDTYDELPF